MVFAAPALAQAPALPCGSHAKVLELLGEHFQESVIAQATTGKAERMAVAEITVSPKGSWSLLISGPDGVTCIIVSGENFEVLRAPGQES